MTPDSTKKWTPEPWQMETQTAILYSNFKTILKDISQLSACDENTDSGINHVTRLDDLLHPMVTTIYDVSNWTWTQFNGHKSSQKFFYT